MVQTRRHVFKRQKTEECTSYMESVLFNSDSLFKIASYLLPADGLLNLALTCTRFGITQSRSDAGGNDSLSLVDETARRVVHDVATDDEMAALPCYDGDNWLCKYNYLQSSKAPLIFDQLVGRIVYVEGKRSCVTNNYTYHYDWTTAFSNNIMMAGKHYASFEVCHGNSLFLGVMRPGEAMQTALKINPLMPDFYNHFTQRKGSLQYNNSVNCCMYSSVDHCCWSSAWRGNSDSAWEGNSDSQPWDGMEAISGSCKIGMLLDLDEGTLSVYKNGRRLGVMKRGLAGHYCWVVAMVQGTQVTIKRGTLPAS